MLPKMDPAVLLPLLADHASEWLFIVRSDRSYLFCSEACTRITGYTPDEMAAAPTLLPAIVHREDVQGTKPVSYTHLALYKGKRP